MKDSCALSPWLFKMPHERMKEVKQGKEKIYGTDARHRMAEEN